MKALVAGSAHLDVIAQPFTESANVDRIGKIVIEVGGTACNVAFGLHAMGHGARLLTAWSGSAISKLIASHVASMGVEVLADEVSDMPLAAFVAQLGLDGDMKCAISSTPVDTHQFGEARIAEALAGVNCVILDANLHPDALISLAAAAHAQGLPVFGLGVSEDKVDRLVPVAGYLQAAIMNFTECERLLSSQSAADASELAEKLQTTLLVTRGDRGAVAYLANGERVRIPPLPLDGVQNLLGVGDAFSAGVIAGIVANGHNFVEAADYAHSLVGAIARSHSCNAFSLNALNDLVGSLYGIAREDKLTGLLMRGAFEDEYRRHMGGANTLIMIDCDNFKSVNDTLGHPAGDEVLRSVARFIVDSTRAVDVACRWGGDEFVLLLPRTGNDSGYATMIAERMRAKVAAAQLHGVTLSIGLVETSPGEDLVLALQRADAAMYLAKRGGKNTVTAQ